METFWPLDGITIARSIRASGPPSAYCQDKDNLLHWQCPQCSFKINNRSWPGLPAGVKYDPSNVELLELLAAKCGVGNKKPNPLIDNFIPTLDVDQGICYTHPENLPGTRKDGKSFHLFYRTINAYASGHQRKRRMISQESSSTNKVYRWHQTGKKTPIPKTPITNNEAPLTGYKMIFVLYETIGGVSKPCQPRWIMHEIHLGTVKDNEIEGALVVSKIFHEPISLETRVYEDVSSAHVLQVPAESQIDDNINLNDAAGAVDLDAILNSSIGQGSVRSNINTTYAAEAAIYTTNETMDFSGLNLLDDYSFSELLYSLEN